MEGFFVETVAGDGRSQDFAWNFHTYFHTGHSIRRVFIAHGLAFQILCLATTVGHLLHTEAAHHSKDAARTAYKASGSSVCAVHCDPTNLRTVRSRRDTPHRFAYS